MKRHNLYPATLAVARALYKFCIDHGSSDDHYNVELGRCVEALENGDTLAAARSFAEIPLGGMGTFADWSPPVAFEHENQEYVLAVFMALIERWSRLMHLLLDDQ